MIIVTEVVHKWIPNPATIYSASMVRLLVSVTISSQPFDSLRDYMDDLYDGQLDTMVSHRKGDNTCVYQPEYDRYDVSTSEIDRMYSTSTEFAIHWQNKFNSVTTQLKK